VTSPHFVQVCASHGQVSIGGIAILTYAKPICPFIQCPIWHPTLQEGAYTNVLHCHHHCVCIVCPNWHHQNCSAPIWHWVCKARHLNTHHPFVCCTAHLLHTTHSQICCTVTIHLILPLHIIYGDSKNCFNV
jgi:hypothetical protein